MTPDAEFHELQVRLHEGSVTVRRLFIKRHKGAASSDGSGNASSKQALFVAGLPLALDSAKLRVLLACFGHVKAVRFFFGLLAIVAHAVPR